jgi:DNA-binding SARP family transcriptional activator
MAIDLLWPESDGDAAVNSLNQTVFQLRRYLDPSYKQGSSAEYVISTAEQVGLDETLVHTDLQAIRRLPGRLAGATWRQRQEIASRAIELVRGEFLADLRYEAWASQLQLLVHNEVRARLLPIARQSEGSFDLQVALNAATALVTMDPFDEVATLALADGLAQSGRRMAARELLIRYAEQVRADLGEEPTDSVTTAMQRVGLSQL